MSHEIISNSVSPIASVDRANILRVGVNDAEAPRTPLNSGSTVLALVPHFQCEEWLGDCLASLVEQTRQPEGIVVIDDCSSNPPIDVVKQFPQVTLLASAENVGPYRLVQQVIDDTAYDAYMFQDADDWSMPERLEVLLTEAERSGAELISTQEICLVCDEAEVRPRGFPLDVNAALWERPTSSTALMHPASLVSRDLVLRLGGFATGLRFAGDSEFVRRATHVARIVNVPGHLYVRRQRAGSLTTSPDTGLKSRARRDLWSRLFVRAQANRALAAQGRTPFLEPFAVADPITLKHLAGPSLTGVRASQPKEQSR